MDKNKKAKIQTMILICLLAVLVNFLFYSYVIKPKVAEVEMKREAFIELGRNQDFAKQQTEEEAILTKEIAALNISTSDYDSTVLDRLDTLSTCHEFYQYLKDQNITGRVIRFTQGEKSPAVEPLPDILVEDAPPEQVLSDDPEALAGQTTADIPNMEPQTEENAGDGENKNYGKAQISLELEMSKVQYYAFLNDLESITKKKIFVEKINFEVVDESSEAAVSLEADTQPATETSEQPQEPPVPTSSSETDLTGVPVPSDVETIEEPPVPQAPVTVKSAPIKKGKEYLKVMVDYVVYLKPGAMESIETGTYDFYTKKKTITKPENLFSPVKTKSD